MSILAIIFFVPLTLFLIYAVLQLIRYGVMWIGAVTCLIVMGTVTGFVALLVPLDWCWRKKQPLLAGMYLVLVLFTPAFIAFVLGYKQVATIYAYMIIALMFICPPAEIGMWIYRFHRWKKGPEPEIIMAAQAKSTEEDPTTPRQVNATLVQNQYGVYVPNGR